MKTYLDCIPCFFKQALEAARIAGADDVTQRQILNDVARVIPEFRLEASPPEMARTIYKVVREMTGVEDPYLEIKDQSNRLALEMYPRLTEKINKSTDPLFTAVELAIAGNIIDYGVKNSLNVDRELEKILANEQQKIQHEGARFFKYEEFKSELAQIDNILYLADNAGEIVFDRVLLEVIHQQYPKIEIYFAVKEKPAINDALEKDARDCGIGTVAQVISSGSDAPGTLLSLCSASFQKLFWNADMVISKGQGNYETLSGVNRPVFFLLLAKCPVIANHIGCRVGDVILSYQNKNVM
ncbi:DUF89 family protein [bacterium]|nr:DUF89 family protein [bacterium]RQV97978.1 MAG: DUF89 family protein [bacterium]